MKTKGLFHSILFGLIGILVIWQIYTVLNAFAHFLLVKSGFFYAKVFLIKASYFIPLIVIFLGFLIGFNAHAKNTLFYKVFRLTNKKIMFALIISLLLLSYLYVSAYGFWHRGFGYHLFTIKILFSAIMFYPFSALILYLNSNKNVMKKYAIIGIIGIVLLSPPLLKYVSHNHKIVQFPIINKYCGAYVYGFMENAPAQMAGMQVGEIINEIEGKKIRSLWDIKAITYTLTSSTDLTVKTNKRTYQITTVFDPYKNKQRIGTNVWQQKCGIKYYGSLKYHKFNKLRSK